MHKQPDTENAALLPVMEQFYTIQGEGAFSGVPAYFIRLAGCDVGCVWCDVKDSWNAENYPKESVESLAENAAASGTRIVVVTGGEPAMYDLTALCDALHSKGLRVHIETSAAYTITGDLDWITISPKKFKFPLDTEVPKADELKIIVFHKSDLEWAEKYAALARPDCKLLLQPEWDKRDSMLPLVIDYVKQYPRWQISLQTHKYIGVP
jgi:7-carboxy-7-deazaguanine synthase